MKRFIACLLMLLYVVSVSGATFNVHFCGSKLQALSFAGFDHKGCCFGKAKPKKAGCCKDRMVSIKAGNDHKQIENISAPSSISKIFIAEVPTYLDLFISNPTITLIPNFHSPPIRDGDTKLFILHSVFRI